MLEPEREELLSAYLDGEVSPAEHARVEQWLTESVELRQLRDELLAMRTELEALPRHKLERNLAAAVLSREQASANRDESRPTPLSLSVSTRLGEWWMRGSAAHRFFWPAVAVAAALAILVFDANQRTEERQVAMAPDAAGETEIAQPMSPPPADESLAGAAAPAGESSAATNDHLFDQRSAKVSPATSPPDVGQISAAPAPGESSPEAMQSNSRDVTARQAQTEGAVRLGSKSADGNLRAPQMRGGDLRQVEAYSLPPAGAKADKPQAIVCSVTPEYLQDNRFELLLVENKIQFERVPITPAIAAQNNKLHALNPAIPASLQSLYVVEAGNQKVNELLTKIPQSATLKESHLQPLPRMTLPQRELNAQAAAAVRVLLIAPNAEPAPAEPAAAPKPAAK